MQNKEKYRLLVENIPDVVWTIEQDGSTVFISPRVENVCGYTPQEICAADDHFWLDRTHPEDVEKVKTACELLFKSNKMFDIEYRIKRKDGNWIWIHERAITTYKKNGVMHADGVFTDITERKQAEHPLKESEQRFKSIFENAPDGMLIADIKTKGFYLGNEVICRMLGYTKEEIKHLGVMDIHSKEDLPYVIEQFEKQARGEITLARNIPVKRKDESIFYADINTILLPLDGKTYMMGIFRDITEQKRMEEEQAKLRDQLYHAQKLASVGKLAGGVAHNFNNLLTVVIGYASLLMAALKEDNPLREYAQKVINSSQTAANLTQDLLAFSRQKPFNPQPVNMNEIINDTEGILSRLIRENINLKTALTKKDCIVTADSEQIRHVLMNLTTNAKDAMPNGGELNICTDVVKIDKIFIKAHGFGKIGKYALISFSDTGMGMDEDTKLRIFDPFFTTKEVGKGTGLGLAIVYGIVKQHNGYIDVDSAPGKGATFRIYLPLIESEAKHAKAEAHAIIHKVGTGTILVAEDAPEVRELAKIVFERAGFRVIEAVDGEDAIDKFVKNKDDITLLVFDFIMPRKNGKEAYDVIKKMKPDVKVLFLSGYGNDVISSTDIYKERLDYILKPVSPMEILEKAKALLEK